MLCKVTNSTGITDNAMWSHADSGSCQDARHGFCTEMYISQPLLIVVTAIMVTWQSIHYMLYNPL